MLVKSFEKILNLFIDKNSNEPFLTLNKFSNAVGIQVDNDSFNTVDFNKKFDLKYLLSKKLYFIAIIFSIFKLIKQVNFDVCIHLLNGHYCLVNRIDLHYCLDVSPFICF